MNDRGKYCYFNANVPILDAEDEVLSDVGNISPLDVNDEDLYSNNIGISLNDTVSSDTDKDLTNYVDNNYSNENLNIYSNSEEKMSCNGDIGYGVNNSDRNLNSHFGNIGGIDLSKPLSIFLVL